MVAASAPGGAGALSARGPAPPRREAPGGSCQHASQLRLGAVCRHVRQHTRKVRGEPGARPDALSRVMLPSHMHQRSPSKAPTPMYNQNGHVKWALSAGTAPKGQPLIPDQNLATQGTSTPRPTSEALNPLHQDQTGNQVCVYPTVHSPPPPSPPPPNLAHSAQISARPTKKYEGNVILRYSTNTMVVQETPTPASFPAPSPAT